MAETYKSQATDLSSTSNTTIYNGVAGTGIVNSIHVSNYDDFLTANVDIFLVKSAVTYSIISNLEVPVGTSIQVLDAPMICESGNSITATATSANKLDIIVSVLEIT